MNTPDPFTLAMRQALTEARRWIGATSPNPPVGAAALDGEGTILAVAAHQRAGQPHAEPSVLAVCQEKGCAERIHTLVVTLEPCAHTGRTPPCTETILRAKIPHVVVGTTDPNPRVCGQGIARLREAGVSVTVGVEEEACRWLIHAFAHPHVTGKPWITLKRAFTPNGSMIPPKGQTTFTSRDSLRLAHRLRKKVDAIITGSGTILADDPSFTVRHVPDHPDKKRFLCLLDRRHRIPDSYLDAARQRGFDLLLPDSIDEALAMLTARGVQDILVEAGPSLSDAFLEKANLIFDITQGNPDSYTFKLSLDPACGLSEASFSLDTILPP